MCALVPSAALPQALTSLSSVRVGYTTRKNTVKPTGELKAQIDALDAQIAEAGRLGRSGELRRLYAKGITLLAGRAVDRRGRLLELAGVADAGGRRGFIEAVQRSPRADLHAVAGVAERRDRARGPAPAARACGAEPAAAGAGDRQGLRHVRRGRRATCANRRTSSTSSCRMSPTDLTC